LHPAHQGRMVKIAQSQMLGIQGVVRFVNRQAHAGADCKMDSTHRGQKYHGGLRNVGNSSR
ncbi:MAG: hypothetical protein RIR09_2930, partial [Pseudomonadota bacterium]